MTEGAERLVQRLRAAPAGGEAASAVAARAPSAPLRRLPSPSPASASASCCSAAAAAAACSARSAAAPTQAPRSAPAKLLQTMCRRGEETSLRASGRRLESQPRVSLQGFGRRARERCSGRDDGELRVGPPCGLLVLDISRPVAPLLT